MYYPCLLQLKHTTCMPYYVNLKITIVYFIIMCSAKAVCAFVVSSVVRGYHEYKDVWNAPTYRA